MDRLGDLLLQAPFSIQTEHRKVKVKNLTRHRFRYPINYELQLHFISLRIIQRIILIDFCSLLQWHSREQVQTLRILQVMAWGLITL